MIVVRRPGADLRVLSVNVRRRVWTVGGIVTQLVTHPRSGECAVIAVPLITCPATCCTTACAAGSFPTSGAAATESSFVTLNGSCAAGCSPDRTSTQEVGRKATRHPYFCHILPAYTHRVQPEARPTPGTEPVKVEVVGAPEPKRDTGWWITTAGPVVVAALALVVAIFSLQDQHAAERTAQAAAARTYASQVSFFQNPSGSSTFEIENSANAQINSVVLQRAPHGPLDRLGTLPPCMAFTVPDTVNLSASSQPVIYFRDVNGFGWELALGGAAQPSVDPSAILALVPLSQVSSLPRAALNPQPVPGCVA